MCWKDLKKDDAAKRTAAGQYLVALLRQAFADESNGRAEWQRSPAWGGGASSPARDFRRKLEEQIGAKAEGEAALEVVRWMIDQEKLPDGPAAAAKALKRIEGPAVEKLLGDLLAPHPHAALAVAAIEEAARRKLSGLAARVAALRGHYRKDLREAATKAATALGAEPAPEFREADAFNPQLLEQLVAIRKMVPDAVPPKAEWYEFVYTDPRSTSGGKPWVQNHSGWLLEEKDGKLEVLTRFGEHLSLPKAETKSTARKLTDVAQEIAKLQKDREASREKLSRRGGLTAQFEPGFISVPAGLVAAWCVERGEKAAAAEVLFPCVNAMQDDRWLTWMLRDSLGNLAHQEMLEAFSGRDYTRTLALADHLSQPIFAEFRYQKRAQELGAQLRKRADDFKTFKLPPLQEWTDLKKTMPRDEQVRFLAARLRLLNCIQWGQPGGVNYEDPQHDGAGGPREQGAAVINPYVELQKLKLEIGELPVLVPALADENFLPTFSYWRDFHPDRTLHRVNWLVTAIVNDAAKRDLAELKKFDRLDEAGRKAHLDAILEWCRKNSGKTRSELLMATISTTKDWRELSRAAGEAMQAKLAGTGSVLMERMDDFPGQRDELAEMVYETKVRVAIEAAQGWLKDKDPMVRFYGALVMLRDGNRAKNEGFAELKQLLEKDDGSLIYPRAIEPLLARKDEASVALACGVLKKKQFRVNLDGSEILHHLLMTGRQEVLDFLLTELGDQSEFGSMSGEWEGKQVQRKRLRGDVVADTLSDWRKDKGDFHSLAPDEERAQKREALKPWLKEQFALIRDGKPSAFKAPDKIRRSRWHLDAP